MIHFPRKTEEATGLYAICGRYDAPDLDGIGDIRRDRFSTDESVILNPDTGCSYCRDVLIEASARPFTRQVWEHSDVMEREQRGELDDGLKPWPTWRAAVRSYVSWQDSGASVRSSSDPGRFEAVPQGFTGIPGGDMGQRQAERLAWVGQALAGAFLDGFRIRVHTETVKLYPSECLQILVALVSGRDADQHTGWSGGKRKQIVRVRIPIADDPDVKPEERRSPHAIVAFEVSERSGFPVTAGTIMAIEKQGGQEIQEALERRGLVLHRDGNLDEAEGSEMVADDGRLRGWKAIADWLGVHEATARDYVKWDPPLPVYKFGAQVEADPGELKAWRAAHTKRVGAA